MPRYKSTGEALKIISNREQIRNFGVIAHVDHGKCIDGDSLVTLTSGEIYCIRELYNHQGTDKERVQISGGLMVDSMNPEVVKIEDRPASAIWHLSSDSLVEIMLSDGRHVVVTPEHPFYTLSPSGFLVAKKAADIKPGDPVAVAGVLKSIGSDLDEIKAEILSRLVSSGRYAAMVDSRLQHTLSLHLHQEGAENAGNALVAGEYSVLHNEIIAGRIRLDRLVQLADALVMPRGIIYDSIVDIRYEPRDRMHDGRSLHIKLPKTMQEFLDLFYLVGILYGAGSSCASLAGRDRLIIETAEKIWGKLGIPADATRTATSYRPYLQEVSPFIIFLEDLFDYPVNHEPASLTVPRLISISRKELVAAFLSGIFDASGFIVPSRKGVFLRTASHKLAERLPLLLLRFGINPVQTRSGRYFIIKLTNRDAALFGESIGFRNPVKQNEFAGLFSDACDEGYAVPIDPRELRTVRVSLGLDRPIISVPGYEEIEDGRKKVTSKTLEKVVKAFEQQLVRKEGLPEKVALLSRISGIFRGEEQPILTFESHRTPAEILESIKSDGLVRLSGRRLVITSLGRDVLGIWRALNAGDSSVSARVEDILNQWKALLKGEVIFRQVKSVENRTGNFSVYDLTVPGTHTYLANGIIVHNTTTSDSLLAACGMLSPSVAGQALALDYMPLEQQRQMTIKAANVTLYYEHEGTPYVFNMIDTPGHIDFTGKVTRSLRAIDGAVVVVDSVEGVMTQTETVTRQALEERVRPVLYINKIDRLVKELRLTPDKMLSWLANIIGEFNNLVNLYAEPEFRDKWKVSIQDNSVAFGSSKDKWGFNQVMAARSGIKFKDVYDAYTTGDPKNLAERSPLHEAILTMVIKHHPPPHVAQGYRIPKIWKGDLNSEVGKALLTCDENGPTVMMVTNVVVDPQAGIVATGRLFSGTVRDGDTVYLLDAKREGRIQSVNMYMGNVREMVGALPAGNIPALLGLEYARSGETLSSVKGIVPFEGIKYVSEPVVTVAIEAKNPRDLPKLVDALQKMHIEDPNLIVKINEESGETLMSGMGVLHLEIATTLLQDQGLDIVTSQPLINYRETIQTKAGPIMSKSPNRHNKIYIRVEPLPEEIIAKIRSGEISETADRKGIAKMLRDMGWDSDEARSVVGVDEKGNMLLDQTKGVQFMQESMDSIRAGFDDVMNNGPLAYEYCRGVKVVIHHFVPHEDPAHRTYAQLMPAARRAILGAMLLAQPVLLEPIQGIEVKCGIDQIGDVTRVLSSKRGKLLNIDQKEVLAIVEGEIPAAETFDLSEVMRGATAGKAVWNIHFKSWNPLPVSLQKTVVAQVRKRKGLPEEVPPPSDFIDTE